MFAIGGTVNDEIKNSLRALFKDAERISIAVSYIQLSGWRVLEEILEPFDRSKIRLVSTDQLGITDPKPQQS
jgi:HKD family nuclease